MTDLESEVDKARFYEKNQYGLHWTLSSTQAKSLQDKCTVSPAIIMVGRWVYECRSQRRTTIYTQSSLS